MAPALTGAVNLCHHEAPPRPAGLRPGDTDLNHPLRIWLNRTYAENAFFIGLLRENRDDVELEIHASHVDADSPVLRAADVSSLERSEEHTSELQSQ